MLRLQNYEVFVGAGKRRSKLVDSLTGKVDWKKNRPENSIWGGCLDRFQIPHETDMQNAGPLTARNFVLSLSQNALSINEILLRQSCVHMTDSLLHLESLVSISSKNIP